MVLDLFVYMYTCSSFQCSCLSMGSDGRVPPHICCIADSAWPSPDALSCMYGRGCIWGCSCCHSYPRQRGCLSVGTQQVGGREGGREGGGREGRKKGRWEGGREGGREGGKEGRKKGGKKGGKEGGREGEREGGREGGTDWLMDIELPRKRNTHIPPGIDGGSHTKCGLPV